MTMPEQPHLRLAGCVILDGESRVLLLHRNTARYVHWELPGGKIDPGEDPADAAKREVAEELGIQVRVERELGRCTFIDHETAMEYVWFLASIASGEPRVMETDTFDALAFFAWPELYGREDLSMNMKELVRAQKAGEVAL